MWVIFSIISCLLATIMQIFNKKVVSGIDPLVVTFIKNGAVFAFSFSVLFFNHTYKKIFTLSGKSIIYIIILGLITFLTYVFFYFALKNGKLSKVMAIDRFSIVLVFVFLLLSKEERINIWNFLGVIFVFVGIFLVMIRE